jgi:hypothetical protein
MREAIPRSDLRVVGSHPGVGVRGDEGQVRNPAAGGIPATGVQGIASSWTTTREKGGQFETGGLGPCVTRRVCAAAYSVLQNQIGPCCSW